MGEIKDFNPPEQERWQTECPECEGLMFWIRGEGKIGWPICCNCGYTVDSQAVLEVDDE